MLLAVSVAVAATALLAAPAATASTTPVQSVTHTFTAAQLSATRGYWTRAGMLSATALGQRGRLTPSRSIPNPSHFNGVPTVGALFFTTGTRKHFCTASAVTSTGGDLVLAAAHCVYNGRYATNIAYDPNWHSDVSPFGLWPVKSITVAQGWIKSGDINLDFAFLKLARNNSHSIQSVTGSLTLGIDQGFNHAIHVIGYNDVDSTPIVCASTSSSYSATQMKFYCNDYQGGTSGGPWILNYDPTTGTGTVFGDIGGYQQGGNFPYLSYSPYYTASIQTLFKTAESLDP